MTGFNERYRQKVTEVNKRPETAYQVKAFDLGNDHDKYRFVGSLVSLPERHQLAPWKSDNYEDIILEALDRGLLLDQLPLQLEDRAKTIKTTPELAQFAELPQRYARRFGNIDNGLVVEYPFVIGDHGYYLHTLPEKELYELIFSRNQLAINPEVQQQLRDNNYGFAGASVGGMVGWLMLMTGATQQRIVDGGALKPHSLNRIVYANMGDVGKNKSLVYLKHALLYFPFAKIDAISQNVDVGNVGDFVNGLKGLVEAVDDLKTKALVQQAGIDSGLPVYAPTDQGLGDALLQIVTTKPFMGHLTTELMESLKNGTLTQEQKTGLAIQIVGKENASPRMLSALVEGMKTGKSYWTQPALAAYLSALMVVTSEVLKLGGEEVNINTRVDIPDLLTVRH